MTIRTVLERGELALTWLDVVQPIPEELDEVADRYGLHPVAVKDCLDPEHLPKQEGFEAQDQPWLTATLFRDVLENAESYHFYADELLDDANTLLNVRLALASHWTGEVMRVLTVLSVFFLPLTLVVGLCGTNFRFMPELRERWGYPAVLGGMAW